MGIDGEREGGGERKSLIYGCCLQPLKAKKLNAERPYLVVVTQSQEHNIQLNVGSRESHFVSFAQFCLKAM